MYLYLLIKSRIVNVIILVNVKGFQIEFVIIIKSLFKCHPSTLPPLSGLGQLTELLRHGSPRLWPGSKAEWIVNIRAHNALIFQNPRRLILIIPCYIQVSIR